MAFIAGLGFTLVFAGVILVASAIGSEGLAGLVGDHDNHGPILARTIVGPLLTASADANVQLEVKLGLEESDSRASGPLPTGIPTGKKVLLTFQLTDLVTGKPLVGLTPVAEVMADGKLLSADGSEWERGDPFALQETYVMVGAAGDLGVIEAGGHGEHKPGAQLSRAFGASLAGMVKLPGPAAEAAIDRENRYIFISIPQRNEVAVVDTLNRQLAHSHPVGKQPFHIGAEPSGERIWVANDGDGTVTSHDVKTHRVRSIGVGPGHHDLAFSTDSRLVFVSNSRSGTVSVIDAEQGRKLVDVSVGKSPHGIDFSAATGRLYVANEDSGTVSVLAVEGDQVTPVAAMVAGEGATQVRIEPSGRVGVVSNKRANTLTVFDAATAEVLTTVKAGGGPDGIVFLEDFALVRNSLTPDVTFVSLVKPDVADEITIGNDPLLSERNPGVHARLFLSAAGDEVLVPSPAIDQLYGIHLMNGHPMLMRQSKVDRGTDFVLSLANRVQEIAPGTYQRIVQFDQAGTYTLKIGLGEGKSVADFTLEVVSSKVEKAWVVEPVVLDQPYVAGREAVVQYRVTDRQTGAAVERLKDAIITVYKFAPGQGIWQRVLPAKHVGDGAYQAKVTFPEAGTYSLTFNSQEYGLTASDGHRVALEVVFPLSGASGK